jgi:cellobiose-specific phosphotransferase system component IIA
VNLYD